MEQLLEELALLKEIFYWGTYNSVNVFWYSFATQKHKLFILT
jgi:hypothetical protein